MGAQYVFIPPRMSNFNSDVESVHNTIENEFYDLEYFYSKYNFFSKISTYQFYYNFFRKNSYKNWKEPVTLIMQ
ncbi:MAG TPA: integrase core domain-containing protein [bacterium]|nr:integrase core domain-containing protein [bacterium]